MPHGLLIMNKQLKLKGNLESRDQVEDKLRASKAAKFTFEFITPASAKLSLLSVI